MSSYPQSSVSCLRSSSSSSSSSRSSSGFVSDAPDMIQRNRCLACNLLDNIWVCMICSYTGCGRYSSQHAKKHYEESRHPFSLELASGRIWNYDHDTFVHIESDSAARLVLLGEFDKAAAADSSLRSALDSSVVSSSINHASVDKTMSAPSHYYLPWARQRQLDDVEAGQPPEVKDKLGVLLSQYEGILEAQLAEQQLYYEKKLAQETIRTLELSLMPTSRAAPSTRAESRPPLTASVQAERYDQDMEEITRKKIELSKLEYSYNDMLTKLREAEQALRRQKQTNNDLIHQQKAFQAQIAENAEKEKVIREQCAERVEELEQQIRDLTFFIR